MKLIDLLVQELPKRGGWPEGCLRIIKDDREDYMRFRFKDADLNCAPAIKFSGQGVVTLEQYEAALAASKQPVWDEDELPPVGTKCLTIGAHGDDSWYECKILAHTEFSGKPVAVFQYGDTISHSSEKWFKPLATEAERKREEATAEMSASIAKYTDMTFLEAIYEAVTAGEIKAFKLAD